MEVTMDEKLYIANFALEPTEKGNPFLKGCFWGIVFSSALWLIIIQCLIALFE